jgi:hypothetical protein
MKFDESLDNMMSDTEISEKMGIYTRNDSTASPYPGGSSQVGIGVIKY